MYRFQLILLPICVHCFVCATFASEGNRLRYLSSDWNLVLDNEHKFEKIRRSRYNPFLFALPKTVHGKGTFSLLLFCIIYANRAAAFVFAVNEPLLLCCFYQVVALFAFILRNCQAAAISVVLVSKTPFFLGTSTIYDWSTGSEQPPPNASARVR